METCIYIFSTALQLAGAILLIIKYWFVSEKKQLTRIQGKRTRVENETLILGENVPNDSEFLQELWLSRIAFIYIACGYIFDIWANVSNANKWVIAGLIVVATGIFVGLGKLISVVKRKTSNDIEIGR